MRTVTSPSMRLASSNSVSATVWPLSAFSMTIARNAVTTALRSRRCRRGCQPRNGLLDDWQVDQRGDHAEQHPQPPDDVVGTGALVERASKIDAEKATDLMAEE